MYVAATGSIYVAMTIVKILFFPLKSINTSAYASMAEVTTCKATINKEIHIVLKIYDGIGESVNTLEILLHSICDGRKEVDPITSALGFNALQTIQINGNAVKAEINAKNTIRSISNNTFFKFILVIVHPLL